VDVSKLVWKGGQRLDQKVSDHTSTLGSNGLVYFAGGCSDPNGNKYNSLSGVFKCGTITNKFYSFDPAAKVFNTGLPSLPRKRYRHTAAWANGRLFLIGGRDLVGNGGGNIVLEVDVYDPASNTWTTPFSLAENQGVSDLASFVDAPNDIYIAGGMSKFFSPQTNVWKINAGNLGSLQIEAVASLSHARGHIKAFENGKREAFVAGGVDSCPSLDSVEKYDIANDKWITQPAMQHFRGDMAVTGFDGLLLAVGGEKALDVSCNIDDFMTGETSEAIADVELLNDSGKWETVPSIPAARFRFDAIIFEEKTYIFGGQDAYDPSCECYPTTDEVLILEAPDAVAPPIAPPPAFCFPGESLVDVLSQGNVKMKDVAIGDMVKVAGGKFSQVYSFGHYEQDVQANYLSIDAGLDTPLILSPDHMVFVENKAVPASIVSAGDKLTLVDGSATVKSIKSVVRTGAFAPFTKAGTVVVDNVVASSYVSLQSDAAELEIGGVRTFGMHHVAHFFQAPHRLVCELRPTYCTTETYTNGLSAWVETPLAIFQWLLKQNTVVMAVGLLLAFTLGLMAVLVEALVVTPGLLVYIFAAFATWTGLFRNKKGKCVTPN